MKRLLQNIIAVAVILAGVTAIVAAPQPAFACTGKECITDGAENVDTGSTKTVPSAIKTVTQVLLFLVGAVSVIMLVIGGFKYVVSNGNAEQIKSAKNTIMYAIIGLVVAIVAYAVVDWVVKQL